MPQDDVSDFPPFREIVRRLTALVQNHRSFFADALLRWAADPPRHNGRGIIPIPLPDDLTDDEQIALLAAIFDSCVIGADQIDPWRRGLPEWPRDLEALMPAERIQVTTYEILKDHIRDLRQQQHWNRHESTITRFIDEVERKLAPQGEPVEQTATRCTDKKSDKPKKLPPHPVNDCARYIIAQRKLIAQGRRPAATKRALIAEHLGSEDTAAMERGLQPSRYGWLLDISGQADK